MSGATKARQATPVTVQLEPVLADRQTAAALLGGIAVSTFEGHVARGALPQPRQLGGRALWVVAELRTAALALPVSALLPPGRGDAS